MLKKIASYTTGSQRGYIYVANRGVESEYKPVPTALTGLRGNHRRAMQQFVDKGATHYTVVWYQGVPAKGYSNRYCHSVYTGYREV